MFLPSSNPEHQSRTRLKSRTSWTGTSARCRPPSTLIQHWEERTFLWASGRAKRQRCCFTSTRTTENTSPSCSTETVWNSLIFLSGLVPCTLSTFIWISMSLGISEDMDVSRSKLLCILSEIRHKRNGMSCAGGGFIPSWDLDAFRTACKHASVILRARKAVFKRIYCRLSVSNSQREFSRKLSSLKSSPTFIQNGSRISETRLIGFPKSTKIFCTDNKYTTEPLQSN